MRLTFDPTAVCLGLTLSAALAPAAVISTSTSTAGSTDGTIIYTPGGQSGVASSAYVVSYTGATNRVVGVSGGTGARTVADFLMAFRLPTMPDASTIASATLTVYLADTNTTTPAFNADLFGLGYRTGTAGTAIQTGTVTGGVSTATGDFNDVDGDGNPTATGATTTSNVVQFGDTDLGPASGAAARSKLADNVLTSSTAVSVAGGTTNAVTVSLTSYIQALYAAGAASTAGDTPGYSSGLGILRLSPDANINVGTGGNVRYDLFTNNDSSAVLAPVLNIDFQSTGTPEPTALTALAVAGLLAGRRRRA